MKHSIKTRDGWILYTTEAPTLADAVVEALSRGVCLNSAFIRGAHFTGQTFTGVTFQDWKTIDCTWTNCTFTDCRFDGVDQINSHHTANTYNNCGWRFCREYGNHVRDCVFQQCSRNQCTGLGSNYYRPSVRHPVGGRRVLRVHLRQAQGQPVQATEQEPGRGGGPAQGARRRNGGWAVLRRALLLPVRNHRKTKGCTGSTPRTP